VIIVSTSDERFVPHFATMLHSAWFHNREAEFYLLDCGITPETLETLAAFATKLGIRLTIEKIDVEPMRDFPTRSTQSAAAYGRLMMASVLPDTCERAIYLDADCIVTSDLSQLWAIDVSQHLIAGVRDNPARRYEIRKGGLRHHTDYVNSGVMLVNLRAWREEDFVETTLSYIRGHSVLAHLDQTAINAIATGRIRIISEAWNFMLGHMSSTRNPPIRPCIVHYAGPCRPWLHCDAMFAAIYLHHRNSTPYPIKSPTLRYRSRFRVALNLIFLQKKYRRRLVLARYYHRTFTVPFLK
jgi:lipopolysaccharide biosynthesis glycosyltransferase